MGFDDCRFVGGPMTGGELAGGPALRAGGPTGREVGGEELPAGLRGAAGGGELAGRADGGGEDDAVTGARFSGGEPVGRAPIGGDGERAGTMDAAGPAGERGGVIAPVRFAAGVIVGAFVGGFDTDGEGVAAGRGAGGVIPTPPPGGGGEEIG
ncbi:hypothetical protein [Lignipirellula cremea]|uniref:hypothetical protein n=1 Tax=Lignipirellula cremea TaxID=2528010 RepID=UPI0011A4C8EB|nr:hypothetical protein [Lignipirellula cremea]